MCYCNFSNYAANFANFKAKLIQYLIFMLTLTNSILFSAPHFGFRFGFTVQFGKNLPQIFNIYMAINLMS